MKKDSENLDYYFNEQGLMVLTAHFLQKRGYCCGNGCLHCPYDYEKVPEMQREFLIQKRLENNEGNKDL